MAPRTRIPRDLSWIHRAAGSRLLYAVLLVVAVSALCLGHGLLAAQDSAVFFADGGLESAVRTAIAKPEGIIYQSDVAGLTALNASARGIASISGIENCSSLKTLYLDRNQIEDITYLSALSDLEQLNLFENRLSDVSPLSSLSSLFYLDLGGNEVSDIDPLAGLTNLVYLFLYDNEISDVSALAGLTRLWELEIEQNQISDISPLSGLTDLAHLYAYGNQIVDITAMSSMVGLLRAYLDSNRITAIPDLSQLTELYRLYLNDNLISDIAPLASVPGITRLRLADNSIEDIAPLVANEGLSQGDEVDLQGNPLSMESRSILIPTLEARGVSVTYDANQSPTQPANVVPADGAMDVTVSPVLRASAFADPDGHAHSTSHWQVSAATQDHSNPVVDNLTEGTNLTTFTIPQGVLSYGTTYYWRVRYQDSQQAWSEWSLETKFTVQSQQALQGVPVFALAIGGAAGAVVLAAMVVFLLRRVRR